MTERRERILALDILRGYFLFVVVVDHLYRFPGLFEIFTGEGKLWVSAAEGFFIISGLLVGYIYGPNFLHKLFSSAKRIWKRATVLYCLSVVFTLAFTVWGYLLPYEGIKAGIWPGGNAWNLIIDTLDFKYIYGWADFLPYYSLFLVFAPVILFLCAKGRWYIALILSFLVWLFRGNNIYAAWQILFMGGIVIGYYLPVIERHAVSIPARARKVLLGALFGITIATLLLSHFFIFGFAGSPAGYELFPELHSWLQWFFDKGLLYPGRMVLSIIWFASAYIVVRRYEFQINRLTHGAFKLLGQNSLLVYSIHAFVLFPINLILPRETGIFQNIIINAVVLLVIIFITKRALEAQEVLATSRLSQLNVASTPENQEG